MALVIQDSVAVAANTTDNNVLSGKRNATIDNNVAGLVTVYATGSAAGLTMDFFAGKRNAIERSAMNTQNRFPVKPDDAIAGGILAAPGDELSMPVENTTGGALTFFYRIEVEEINPSRLGG